MIITVRTYILTGLMILVAWCGVYVVWLLGVYVAVVTDRNWPAECVEAVIQVKKGDDSYQLYQECPERTRAEAADGGGWVCRCP